MCEKSAMRDRQCRPRQGLYRKKVVSEVLSENAVLACSACGGDYEDPERTAWGPDAINDYEDDDNRTAEMMEEEFPAEK